MSLGLLVDITFNAIYYTGYAICKGVAWIRNGSEYQAEQIEKVERDEKLERLQSTLDKTLIELEEIKKKLPSDL